MSFKRGFFEYLKIAGVERIHSQMIAWLLSKDSPLDLLQKNKFLSMFIGSETKHGEIDVSTEELHIDIHIRADGNQLYIIENKLKSSERNDQLKKYSDTITTTLKNRTSACSDHESVVKFFLTLVGENPSAPDWINRTYEDLLKAVEGIQKSLLPKDCDQIVSSYQATLNNLINALKAFNDNHQRFPNVFTDGKKTKAHKQNSTLELQPAAKYIADCQLETIFQKLFFQRVAGKLKWNLEHGKVSETRGSALCQVDFKEDEVPVVRINNRDFIFGFQVQGSSVKLNFHIKNDYQNSKKEWIEPVIPVFENFANSLNACGKIIRVNYPRSLAYLSLSRNVRPYEYSFDDLCCKYKQYRNEVREWALELVPKITQDYP